MDTVNLTTGKTTPFIKNLLTAKGLVYLDATGSEPVLSLGAAADTAKGSTPAVARTPDAAVTKSSSDSDALPLVLAIVALVLAFGLGGLGLARRGASPS